jgi:hypothetical protein
MTIIAAPENRVTARAAAGRACRTFRAEDPRGEPDGWCPGCYRLPVPGYDSVPPGPPASLS